MTDPRLLITSVTFNIDRFLNSDRRKKQKKNKKGNQARQNQCAALVGQRYSSAVTSVVSPSFNWAENSLADTPVTCLQPTPHPGITPSFYPPVVVLMIFDYDEYPESTLVNLPL